MNSPALLYIGTYGTFYLARWWLQESRTSFRLVMPCCEASSGVGAGLWLGRVFLVQLRRPEFSSVPYIVGGMDTVRVLLGPWLPGCPGPLLHGVAGCGYHPAQGVGLASSCVLLYVEDDAF